MSAPDHREQVRDAALAAALPVLQQLSTWTGLFANVPGLAKRIRHARDYVELAVRS